MRRIFKEKAKNSEVKTAYKQMVEQIKQKGGALHFVIKTDQNGWAAACREFPGIVTGGDETDPSQTEIYSTIIDAVKTAFNVPINNEMRERSPYGDDIMLAIEHERPLV